MEPITIHSKFNALPEHLKREAVDFIEFLFEKKGKEQQGTVPKPTPIFGSCKGMFKMTPDFDDPLEDFKEYMF